MIHPHRCFVLVLLLGYCTFGIRVASAQVQTGTPPFGSYGGGPEIINLANLNAHLNVPIRSKAGRGTDFNYGLAYDSSVWYPVASGSTQAWQPVMWGWTAFNPNILGYATYKTQNKSCRFFQETQWVTEYYVLYYGYVYVDPLGTRHPLNGGVQNGGAPDCGPSEDAYLLAADGSGYTLYIPDETLYGKTGEIGVLTGGVFTDRNGNQITQSGGVFTDTLGQTALSVAGSGTPSSPMTFSYTAPSGGSASYTMKFTAYTVQTNFGCPNISEYGPTSNNLVSEIDLPDGSKYTFTYEGTPGHAGNVTGRLASVVLPMGGTISYSYSGGSNGITCADGSTAGLTRTTPDGTWTYSRSGTTPQTTTTITDPQSNVTVDNFSGIYLTQSVINQGSSTQLETISICYNGNFSNCPTATVSAPISRRAIYRQFPNLTYPGASDILYDSYGDVTDDKEFDFVANSNDYPYVTDTSTTYASLGNIVSFPHQVTVKNTAGTVVSQTTYNYDETAVTATSGTPQHTSVSGSRGNLTSIDYPAGSLVSHNTYYDTGTLNTSTDVNGAVTTYGYAGTSCGNAFPTSVSEPLGLSRSMTWNCTGAVQLTAVDENNQTVTNAYSDAWYWRPASVTDQQGYATTYYYQPSTQYCCPWLISSSLTFNNGNSDVNDWQYLDGLGRKSVDQRYNLATGQLESTSNNYDANGRLYSTSMPCVANWGNGCSSSTPKTTYLYDALSRPTLVVDGGGGTVTYTYSQNDVLVSVNAPSGENAKRRQLEYDALGRLTSVCEITNATGSGTCGQNNPQTGFWTKYTYDALNNLLTVIQNAQSSTTQTRSYTYDAMGRLLSESNPESGTTTYTYDVIPNGCYAAGSGEYGDLTEIKDNAGNLRCFLTDALHRVTGIGPSSVPPCKRFSYDKTSNGVAPVPSGATISNALGRLVEAETDSCGNWPPIPITDEWFSYTARGETSDVWASTPNSGGYYHTWQTYWANGVPNVLQSGQGYYEAYKVDGEGRPYQVSPYSGPVPVTNTTYNISSLPTAVTYGSGDSDSFTYDSNTNRMTQYKFTVGSSPQSLVGNLTWNSNGTLQTQNITDPFNSANAQNCSYGYDDLARIGSANCGSAAAQTFSYDSFGNINKSGSPYSFQPTYSSSTNRMGSIGSCTPTYDGDGNVTNDCNHTYGWDNYGRPITIDSVSLTYDAFGRMAEQNRSGAYTQFVYSPTGFEMQIMNGQSATKLLVPLPGGGEVVYNASGMFYYHSDHLGSFRFGSSYTNRNMYFDLAYAPFGETYATSGSTDISFTGQRQDTVSGLYDFPAREYSIQGRWPSPDPAGLAAVDPTNPQTWNRYAYVMNNPLNSVDPTGLSDCAAEEHYCDWNGGTGEPGAGLWGGPFFGPGNPGNGCEPGDASCDGGFGIGMGIDFGGSGTAGGGGRGPVAAAPLPNPPINVGLPAGFPGLDDSICGIAGCSFLQVPVNPQVIDEGWQFIIRVLVVGTAIYEASKIAVSNIHLSRSVNKVQGIPRIDQLQTSCKEGRKVVEPSTKYPGGISVEQEYICSYGVYTVHELWDAKGVLQEIHVRPGPPKGGA